ncbi:RagB/SusD family nutrient uptake outer membrane protein [Mucilaginibacter ginsenosidivorax]|uniref:RagB/SusD family nutrient uptake outer membrane protein n=1 Tax=Mucilaginibacter ginsenosidivorax TaxID=862126 RepID=A0A5B8W5M7_9SPHI|nr:RagB/SusD family nutrient uptake outer membrane protein [Mucilaginibacter ginsenosidivorax]QEC78889.1 RagB/SusD family nutrient uptake outer membrane protein [Mucilaginibacter ginsenosidivorax]
MKIYYKYLFMVSLIVSCISCKKYLDVTPDNVGTIDYAFRNRNEAENYLFTCYSQLQRYTLPQYNVGFVTSSEIIFPIDLNDNSGIDATGFNLIRGTQSSQNPGINNWDGNNGGQATFKAIRQCNTMLENIDKPVDLSAAEKKRWIAEVKFLKAYYHFYLFRLYGSIPIVDKNLPINASAEEVKIKRAPVDSVVNYMVRLLDEAAPDLPPVIQNQAKELGRITKPIALAVKAQILATAASPLFNGNPDYVSIKNKDGQLLFSNTYDASKWDKASAACLDAINVAEINGIKLHKFNPPANIPSNLTDSLKELLTIQTAITEKWDVNTELIWALNGNFGYQPHCGPRLTSKSAANITFPGTFAVPISEQELFYTDKGVPINEDKSWDYLNRYDIRTGDAANRFYIGKGYETVKAHFNREPRFYADIAFDGGIWYGNGNFAPEGAYYVQAKGNTSLAGPKDNIRINVTGYWPKKLVNYLTVHDDGYTIEDYHMPLVRLADLYLLYAETLNEQGKPYASIVTYLDKVRQRAGLPGVVEAWTNYSKNPTKYATQDGLRQIIHQERRIELAFEGQAGWDLRRWKELQQVLSKPLQGWNVYETTATNYYRPRTLLTPVFNVRDYMWPIAADDLISNNNLVQNLNW